jgi:hypothetical protein
LKSIGFVLRAWLILLPIIGTATAQNPPAPTSGPVTAPARGPVPPAIIAARSIFVSNAGADSGLFPKPFRGDTDRAYSQFFTGLKATGAFDIVLDPSDADLVLELQLLAPTGPKDPDKQKGGSEPVPEFRLTVYDRKSHYILWTLIRSIGVALLQKTHDRNFDDALSGLVQDFLELAGKQAPPRPTP